LVYGKRERQGQSEESKHNFPFSKIRRIESPGPQRLFRMHAAGLELFRQERLRNRRPSSTGVNRAPPSVVRPFPAPLATSGGAHILQLETA